MLVKCKWIRMFCYIISLIISFCVLLKFLCIQVYSVPLKFVVLL